MKNEKWKRSPEAQLLIDLLAKLQPGETIGDEAVKKETGLAPMSTRGQGIWQTAHKALLDAQVKIVRLDGAGYKRLTDAETVEYLEVRRKRMRRQAVFGKRESVVPEFDKLPQELKVKVLAHQTIFAMSERVSESWARKRIENKVAESMKILPLAHTLEALKNGD